MLLKPDELPEMVKGEARRVELRLAGAVGINSITGCTATGDNLTIGSPAINGANVSFLVTANQAGRHYMLVACTLSSNETIKANIRVDVVSDTPCSSSDDYR